MIRLAQRRVGGGLKGPLASASVESAPWFNTGAVPTCGPRSAQNQSTQVFDEFGCQAIVLDEKAHVDRTVERIKKEVEIRVLAEFSAGDCPTKSPVGLATPRPEEAFAERFDEVLITLPCRQDGRNDASAPAAEDLYKLAHLLAHIGVYRSRVWKMQLPGGAAGKGVRDERAFIGPPAIHRGFPDFGLVGNLFHLEIGKAVSAQKS